MKRTEIKTYQSTTAYISIYAQTSNGRKSVMIFSHFV